MLNTEHVFKRLQLGDTATEAIGKIRQLVTTDADPVAKAKSIVQAILGIEPTIETPEQARLIAMKVGESAFKVNHNIAEPADLLKSCQDYVSLFLANPANKWMFAVDSQVPEYTAKVVKGIDVAVPVKDNGKIKKGGKQILAAELYKKYVLEAKKPATNQEFIMILVKELGMSKAGATTYAYNCKKQLGEPAGGLVKAKKGRKAKKV